MSGNLNGRMSWFRALQMRLQKIDAFVGCANEFGEYIASSITSQ
jgi:hypothetical protein